MAVVEAGSFTAAAERLCVTQSAVSRRIRQLEDHYGVSLLDRGAESVQPTSAGRAIVEKAREILDIERELESVVGTRAGRDRLSFCCTPCFGTGRLPDVFERYVGSRGLEFDLNVVFEMPEDVLDGLASGRYDVAVVEHCDDLAAHPFQAFELPVDEMVFVSSAGQGIAGGEIPISLLTDHRLYLKTHNGCAYRFLRRRLRGLGRDINDFANIVYYDDLTGVLRQVMAGHGIGFVSRDLAGREIEGGLLREHRIAGFGHERPRTLLLSPRMRHSVSTRRFIATFFEALGQPVPDLFASAVPGDEADPPVIE